MSDSNQNHLRHSSMADSEKTATQSTAPSVVEKSAVQTVVPSANEPSHVTAPITGIGEKGATAAEADAQRDSTSKRDSTGSAAGAVEEDDDFEYPTKWKLTAITIALCLSVFCMALVRIHSSNLRFYHPEHDVIRNCDLPHY